MFRKVTINIKKIYNIMKGRKETTNSPKNKIFKQKIKQTSTYLLN